MQRILLIGGAAKNPGVAPIASALFGREVLIPPAGEYVADGAAKQAAWALLGGTSAPRWSDTRIFCSSTDQQNSLHANSEFFKCIDSID